MNKSSSLIDANPGPTGLSWFWIISWTMIICPYFSISFAIFFKQILRTLRCLEYTIYLASFIHLLPVKTCMKLQLLPSCNSHMISHLNKHDQLGLFLHHVGQRRLMDPLSMRDLLLRPHQLAFLIILSGHGTCLMILRVPTFPVSISPWAFAHISPFLSQFSIKKS